MFMTTILLAVMGAPSISATGFEEATDISHWQETVNFDQVIQSGIQIVIHKATQGLTYVDPEYAKRQSMAKASGLKYWGAYHFADNSNGKQQAHHFLDVTRGANFLAVDLEPNGNRTVSLQQAEEIVQTVIEETGKPPFVYGGAYFLNTFKHSNILAKCPLWVASWREGSPLLPTMWKEWIMWQHTDGQHGAPPYEVHGIGKCDRNKVNEQKFLEYLNR